MWHAISQVGWSESKVQGDGSTGDRVLDRGLVDEWDGVAVLLALPDIGDARILDTLNEKGGLLVAC